jgi:excisionase family DNA binding protein
MRDLTLLTLLTPGRGRTMDASVLRASRRKPAIASTAAARSRECCRVRRHGRDVNERLLTTREVAERFGVVTETILRWVRCGRLPAIRISTGAIRFRESEIESWLDEHATAAPGREARTVPTGAAAETVPSSARTVPLRSAVRDEED